MRGGRCLKTLHPLAGVWMATCVMLLAGAPAASQPSVASYQLGPGDVLEVSIWGYPDLTRQVAVASDGQIALPLIGSIFATGTSIQRLRTLLAKAYAEYILDPQVTVLIKEFRKVRVSMLGQVIRPGTYELPAGAHVLDSIAAAGGVTEAAALKEVQVMRPGASPVMVDLAKALAGDQSANLPLSGGETLIVPEDFANLVTVEGQVTRPGRYRLKSQTRLLDALMLAGGLTDRASIAQARLVRASGASVDLSLDGLLLHQDQRANLDLQPGDTIFIPEDTNNKFFVIGDVRGPGAFTIKGDLSILQAIAMAGGPEPRGTGTAKTAYIIRRGGGSPALPGVLAGPATMSALPNGRSILTLDLAAMIRSGDITQDVPVKPGDVIVVPQTGLSAFGQIINVLAGIFTIFK